jgi:hypothetical protein
MNQATPVAPALNPVRLHFIEALARRSAGQSDQVKRLLDQKRTRALAAAQAQAKASTAGQVHGPQLLQNKEQTIEHSLGQTAHLATISAELRQRANARDAGAATLHFFRESWSHLSTARQVAKALDLAPKNAGPINSHGLVLRSLALMREVSPSYLNRFVAYADTLIALEASELPQPTAKPTAKPKPAKPAKPKPRTSVGRTAQTGKP